MSEVDPGLAIVVAVLGMVVVFLALGWRQRRRARARMETLRGAERVEIPIASVGRGALLLGVPLIGLAFVVPFIAMALGEWGRAHALELVLGFLFATTALIVGLTSFGARWVDVGQVVLDADELRASAPSLDATIALDEPWTLREGVVPPGRSTEIVMEVRQGDARITIRYPLLLGDEEFAAGLPVVAPHGVLLGAETKVLHERLRERGAPLR
ncbi:MAG: hypothetical protein AB7S26_16800 [Sandaracinaceae bacterium]